jgi:hypothetical protein
MTKQTVPAAVAEKKAKPAAKAAAAPRQALGSNSSQPGLLSKNPVAGATTPATKSAAKGAKP